MSSYNRVYSVNELSCGLFYKVIKEFRDEEMEHHDTGLEHDAETVRIFNIRDWLIMFSDRCLQKS